MYSADMAHKTKEKKAEYDRGYYERNSESLREYRKKYYEEHADEINERLRKKRATNVPVVILWESRKKDKKKGLENDLDIEFISKEVKKGCIYCEDRAPVRMTLDRIDNTLGHLKSNVVPACERCNRVRGDMPHKAWLIIAPAMKQAREEGLFGNWEGWLQKSRRKR